MPKPKLHETPRAELIGLEARVSDSTNPSQIGASGTVVGETRNTFTLQTSKGEKIFVKAECVFSFKFPVIGWVKIEGKVLEARPEDRIKKKLKSW